MAIDILGLNKVSWQSAGKIISGRFEIFYSGSTEYERRVAFVLDQELGKTFKGYRPQSDHVLFLKIEEKPLDLKIYVSSSDNGLEKFL